MEVSPNYSHNQLLCLSYLIIMIINYYASTVFCLKKKDGKYGISVQNILKYDIIISTIISFQNILDLMFDFLCYLPVSHMF